MARTVQVFLLVMVVGLAACERGDAATTTTVLTATSTSLPALHDHGLGWGFHLGSADQTVGLFMDLADYEDFFAGALPEVTVLPDSRWVTEVYFGHDLFSRSGPLVVPSDPRPLPVIDEVWPVVAGTITILETPPIGECGLARALLQGLVAVTPAGTRMYLGDFQARNENWGCLAQ